MKVLRDFKNSLLGRREVEFILEGKENPGFEGARKAAVEEFKAQDDLIVVKKVEGKFGSNDFLVDVFIYDSVERKDKVEPKKKEKKK